MFDLLFMETKMVALDGLFFCFDFDFCCFTCEFWEIDVGVVVYVVILWFIILVGLILCVIVLSLFLIFILRFMFVESY